MRIILVTTPQNEVQQQLQTRFGAAIINSTMERQECLEAIQRQNPDVLITYRCHHILPDDIINKARLALNIHPSLLPAYAGLNPWYEMARVSETKGGVTIHKLSTQPDVGEIICQASLTLNFSRSLEWNRHNADVLAARMIIKTLNQCQNE